MSAMSMNVWESAAEIVRRHLTSAPRLEALLEALPSQSTAVERRRCRHLVYGVIRHRALLDHALHAHLRRPPRAKLHAALLTGAFELLEHPEDAPVIVHHAVACTRAWASPAEARVVNAILRHAADTLPAHLAQPAQSAAELALRFSHPEWLVERWLARWGEDKTRRLLEWDQQPGTVYARALRAVPLPPGFEPTVWSGFHRLERPDWNEVERLLADGTIYLQDPATSLAPDLLAPTMGETVLDLCAAPGGKTLQLAARVRQPGSGSGRVLAVDLPGPRLRRLRENLRRYSDLPIDICGADVTTLTPGSLHKTGVTPAAVDAILLDVPCSNTGVLRHRVDVKWRLRPDDLAALPVLQLTMLHRAADLLRPGGRLVYSTCSLEPEENGDVIQRFLETHGNTFRLENAVASLPWESQCDGAGAFLLTKSDGL